MKKLAGIMAAVGIIAALGIGAYAHGGGGWKNTGRSGWNGGHMMGGWNARGNQGYCGGYGPGSMMGGWNAPGQPGTAQEALTEDQIKESVQAYIDQYLPGYAIETLEQDQWRPMTYATLKGENGAELQLFVHNFTGQVMHVFGLPAEDTPEE